MTTIALAGNPNCGKTTMFNALTGAAQYVGNWPGVTVERKSGKVKSDKNIQVTDLPGIYSLSPYTPEEVVSRDYLASDEPAAVLNVVDATNIERNLYLTTQILELGKPVVIALNMMDVLKKSGGKIDTAALAKRLGCKIVETSALKGVGVADAIKAAADAAKKNVASESDTANLPNACFSDDTEKYISQMQELVPSNIDARLKRWYAIKMIERDSVVMKSLSLSDEAVRRAEEISSALEKAKDDDTESIITNERYEYIARVLKGCLKKSGKSLTVSDKIDQIVTNRILGIPIFLAVMWVIYYLSISTVGTFMTDWTNDTLFGEWILGGLENAMTNAGANPVLIDCIVNGIVGGVGTILGFVPQMAVLFLLLCIIEDVGYMTRIAFVMDRVFHKFGLSGKSFIPLLIGSGCGVPGIMASKTIENDNDRRLTIMTTTWIPCGAKLPVIALMAAVMAQHVTGMNGSWVAPAMYAIGIASVLTASVILKKTKPFHGPAAPFIMELPQYHLPQVKTVLLHTWERLKGFIIKAGTVLFLACLVMWFLSSYGFVDKTNPDARNRGQFGLTSAIIEEADSSLEFADASEYSVLATVGNGLRYIFIPLGFGNETGGWQASAATISGFVAKEQIVGTMGVLAGASDEDIEAAEGEEDASGVASAIAAWFPSSIAAFSFLLFNLLCSPCLAAIATMAHELKSRKWFWFAILFQNAFAYIVTFCVYQFGMLFTADEFSTGTLVAVIFAVAFLAMLFRPDPFKRKNIKEAQAVAKSA